MMEQKYYIQRVGQPVVIDADWDKPVWRGIEPVNVVRSMGSAGGYHPATQAKLGWDEFNIYVVFKVDDQYVRAVATEHFGNVWRDSCVEFFFTPGSEIKGGYFNLETNCIGSMLMYHQQDWEMDRTPLAKADLAKIELATSLPKGQAIEPELSQPVTWTLEYALPWQMLTEYAVVERPEPGVLWRGNFYKCVEENSHPHWLTWAEIALPEPDFHQPAYFGSLEFIA